MEANIPDAYGETLLGRFDRKYLDRPHVNAILLAVVAVILSIAAVQTSLRIREVDSAAFRAGGQRHRTALGRWLPDAVALSAGGDPYGVGHWFPTPPLVLMSLVPLSKMSYMAAGIFWSALKVWGALMAIVLLNRSLCRAGIVIPTGVWMMTAVFGTRAVYSEIGHANVNTYMMIWLTLAWVLFLQGKDFWAGLFVALAVVTKITPALLLVYFLYKRAWRVGLGAIVGLALFFFVIPGLYLGFGRNWVLLTSWYHMLVEPFAREGYAALEIANQSLYGVLVRILSNAGILKIQHMPGDQELASGMEGMARPATMIGKLLRPAISIVVLGALAWSCRARISRRQDPRLFLEYGLVMIAMLLLSERTWKHHATSLPLIYLGVWYALTCLPWSESFRAWFVAGLGVQFILLVGFSEGVMGDRLADRMMDGGFFCWGLVLAFVQSVILCRLLTAREEKVLPNSPV